MRSVTMAVAAVLLAAGSASAQQKASGANPAAAGIGNVHEMVKRYVIGAAELVPEERYSYQPTKDVRTFGQLVAHIVDAQNNLCSSAKGSATPYSDATEKSVTKKADLLVKLRESFAACDAVYGSTTDAALANRAEIFGSAGSVAQALSFNAAHNWEHYGNMATYMRMMGIVPPSSR